MSHEYIIAFGTLVLSAIGIWALGWHYGVKSFRNRNRALHMALEQHRLEMEEWGKSPDASNWRNGYVAGQKSTLEAIDAFVANHPD